MKQIPDETLLKHLSDGIRDMTPDHSEALWAEPVEQADGSEWFLDNKQKPSGKRFFISTIAACLLLCLVSTLLFRFMPSASVYLDVNPSITLKVNYRNRVTDAVACNDDAAAILGGMDLKGTDLDVALYAILGSMVHQGYLTQEQDVILVSVHSANSSRAATLETEVTGIVARGLDEMIHAGEILSQQVEQIPESDDDYSPGRAAFIADLRQRYPQLRDADLEHMTMDEIISLLVSQHLDYSDYLDDDDDPDFPDDPDDQDPDHADGGHDDDSDDDVDDDDYDPDDDDPDEEDDPDDDDSDDEDEPDEDD